MATVNHAAQIALRVATDCVREAMLPGTVTDEKHYEDLRKAFQKDFDSLISDDATYAKLETHIKRLFRYVGTAALLIAEAESPGVDPDKIPITYGHLEQACKLVEIAICPRPPSGALRLCRLTSILDNPDATDKLVDLVTKRYEEYKKKRPGG